MAPPPPPPGRAVVAGSGTRPASETPSSSASRVCTRAIPQSAKNAALTASSPASAPVWDWDSSAPAAERPSLYATIGRRRARAAAANRRRLSAPVTDSRNRA